jgi:hypothetical protein
MHFSTQLNGHRVSFLVILAGIGSLLATRPASAALIHRYNFESLDAGLVDDLVVAGATADGTLTNGGTIGGGSLNLDGTDDYVQFGTTLIPTSGSFTIALFFQHTNPDSGYREFISQGSGFYTGRQNTGKFRVGGGTNWSTSTPTAGGVFGAEETAVVYPTNTNFHHFALTYDSSTTTVKLYLDGVLASTLISSVTGMTGNNTRFGRQFGGNSEYFNGSMDDLRIYDNALTASEVSSLVPEPTSMALLGVTGVLATLRHRRR